ncbi:CENP-V/GFA domain-containing protein [Fusarium keratoplasticum]|uniref:CENP-V/GFA domain-containing protein n=1 Tax=Fusarium keratoplasticum TaxID=1328300 RepID=A0ACC0QGR7_9HYPO|nr:CENP-V/GFA domain-containing protein [Fusarium keratoplasticum]KAI8652530.1 CENP-V/GFA domain-containing protein [Fusarium keratoplasticum]
MEKTPPHSQKLRALFGELASFYIFRGSHLSLLNSLSLATAGKDVIRSDIISEDITDVELRASRASNAAKHLAEGIKSDIIVLTNTTSTVESLGAEAVGAEFLVLAVMLKL